MPVLLLRYGLNPGCDLGIRLSVGVAAADYKCLMYERERVAVSVAPQLGYVYTLNESQSLDGDGVVTSFPVLASLDATPWLRLTVSPGVAFVGGQAFLLSNDTVPWLPFVGPWEQSGMRRSSPILDGMYGRAGFGIEFHSRVFSVQPEVTVVHGLATQTPVTSLHTGLALMFGAPP